MQRDGGQGVFDDLAASLSCARASIASVFTCRAARVSLRAETRKPVMAAARPTDLDTLHSSVSGRLHPGGRARCVRLTVRNSRARKKEGAVE